MVLEKGNLSLHFDSTFNCLIGDPAPPTAAKHGLVVRRKEQLPEGAEAWEGREYFSFFTVVFSSPRKSPCPDRDPKRTRLGVRDEGYVLTKAGCNGWLCFQQQR